MGEYRGYDIESVSLSVRQTFSRDEMLAPLLCKNSEWTLTFLRFKFIPELPVRRFCDLMRFVFYFCIQMLVIGEPNCTSEG